MLPLSLKTLGLFAAVAGCSASGNCQTLATAASPSREIAMEVFHRMSSAMPIGFEGEISSEAGVNDKWKSSPPMQFPPTERGPLKMQVKCRGANWRIIHSPDSGLLPNRDIAYNDGCLYVLAKTTEASTDRLEISYVNDPENRVSTYDFAIFYWSKYAKRLWENKDDLQFANAEGDDMIVSTHFGNVSLSSELVKKCGVYGIKSVTTTNGKWIREYTFDYDCLPSGEWAPSSFTRATMFKGGERAYEKLTYKPSTTPIGDNLLPSINRATRVIDNRVSPPYGYTTSEKILSLEDVLAKRPESKPVFPNLRAARIPDLE